MLIYHPAYDAYHCVFRLIKITEAIREIEFVKLRILDFYLCFPAEIASIELPQSDLKLRAAARAAKSKFRGPVSSLRTFRDLESIQRAAARLLAASQVFDSEKLETGSVARTSWTPSGSLYKLVERDIGTSPELTDYILNRLSKLPLGGIGGLKQRTGLMEYRYDAA